MIAYRTREENGVSGARHVSRKLDISGGEADAGGGDEDAVALAALHHFGVSGDDRDIRCARGVAHTLGDAPQIPERKPLLKNEARGHV